MTSGVDNVTNECRVGFVYNQLRSFAKLECIGAQILCTQKCTGCFGIFSGIGSSENLDKRDSDLMTRKCTGSLVHAFFW